MIQNHRSGEAMLTAAAFPVRLLYRAVLIVITLLVLGFSYAVGGVPRIERPEKKNRMTHVNPK